MVRQRPEEAYSGFAPTVKFGGGSGGTSARLESATFIFVKGAWIKSHSGLSWKKTCFLLLWQCSLTLRIVFFQQDNAPCHTARSRCGWRTTRSRPCHGQPNLQTWTPLKTYGRSSSRRGQAAWIFAPRVAWSHLTAMWKTGGKHAKTQESCDWKSGSFHQILISELFLS